MPEDMPGVWVFMGLRAQHPAAVFTTLEKGEAWVRKHGLEGMLTWYPLDVSVFDWVVAKGKFRPKLHQQTPEFLAQFSSASQPHRHYENPEPPLTSDEH
ncbi:hypothetical protein DAERI_010574 [Deinococcus aerius]|uniref:DUF7710 domain-containing protein n=1 Tax=Deinococcus aerius TaxID=200253 RepID=A0A2I9CS25_9DEIO|nr:hypothetical protein [Deinococcus aerius]GBF04402.1 hypothetical protein DAERI_010574 [Deinococcus aerius]